MQIMYQSTPGITLIDCKQPSLLITNKQFTHSQMHRHSTLYTSTEAIITQFSTLFVNIIH